MQQVCGAIDVKCSSFTKCNLVQVYMYITLHKCNKGTDTVQCWHLKLFIHNKGCSASSKIHDDSARVWRRAPMNRPGRHDWRREKGVLTKQISAKKYTQFLYDICTTSAQRLRRWSDVAKMSYKCFVFAGERASCRWDEDGKIAVVSVYVLWWHGGHVVRPHVVSRLQGGIRFRDRTLHPADETTAEYRPSRRMNESVYRWPDIQEGWPMLGRLSARLFHHSCGYVVIISSPS